jgi:hypothetical protein
MVDKQEPKEQMQVYLEPDLIKAFKKSCIDESISYSDKITELIKWWLKSKKKSF